MHHRWQSLDEAVSDIQRRADAREEVIVPEEMAVHIRVLADPDSGRACGIRFQRCGGGRRIIRKGRHS